MWGAELSPKAPSGAGWAEALACGQAHPLSSSPAAHDARQQRAHPRPSRQSEHELLEALELGAPTDSRSSVRTEQWRPKTHSML